MVAILKDALQAVSRSRLFDVGVSFMERRLSPQDDTLRVLMYHRVDRPADNAQLWPGMIGPSPDEFARHTEVLSKNYRVVSLSEVLEVMRGNGTLPPRAVLITFDDGYRDFAKHAWPVLRQHALPVVMFVATAYPDSDRHFWWDRLHRAVHQSPEGTRLPLPWGETPLVSIAQRRTVFRRLKVLLKSMPHAEALRLMDTIVAAGGVPDPCDNGVMSWDELARLHDEGVTLAPHTRTHPMLNQLSGSEIRDEISQSWIDLVEHFGSRVPRVLAYPAGGVNEDVSQVTRELGFELAFGTERGVNRPSTMDRFRIRRINVGSRTTLGLLRAQLAVSAD